jgi:hypothetical protein
MWTARRHVSEHVVRRRRKTWNIEHGKTSKEEKEGSYSILFYGSKVCGVSIENLSLR